MEREKQKKLDRERMLQERERRLRLQQEEEERAMREIEEKPIMPLKSKFVRTEITYLKNKISV